LADSIHVIDIENPFGELGGVLKAQATYSCCGYVAYSCVVTLV
jgi:hypothetical protein